MKTAILTGYGGLEKISYINEVLPIPLIHVSKSGLGNSKKNELLIKIHCFALNPKDILIRKGKFKLLSGKNFPQQIGFEFSGVVFKASSFSKFQEGDKVIGLINGFKGKCSSEYVCIKENFVFRMPENINFSQASGISLVGLTALQSIRDLVKPKKNMSICINGASGGVGSIAIQIAKIFFLKVTAITSTKNLKLCQSLGANDLIDYTQSNVLLEGKKYDVFFDVFGNYNFKKIKHLLNKEGTYITTVPNVDIFKQQFKNLFRNKKAMLVVIKSNQKDLEWLVKNIENNQISPVIDKIYKFNQIAIAQKYLETKRAKGKVIISMN